MFKIGCHLSTTNGYENMARQIIKMGGNTFQFFTRNPRGGKAKDLNKKDILAFKNYCLENNIDVFLAHAPYTLNPASKDEKVREFAHMTMKEDLKRLEEIGGSLYNFHPGSHVGQGVEVGIDYIVTLLNEVITKDLNVTILLETMAGKGTEIGSNFKELKTIIDGVKLNEKVGVCLDTCHINDAGYDIVKDIDKVLKEFDEVVGLKRLKAIHLNDSKNPRESHKDRHEKIGEGHIGLEAISKIINDERLKDLPFYLETPNEIDGYEKEIALLKNLRKTYGNNGYD